MIFLFLKKTFESHSPTMSRRTSKSNDSGCPYVFKKGVNQGKPCGVRSRDGQPFCKKHRSYQTIELNKMAPQTLSLSNPDQVRETLDSHLTPKETEKKSFGEVFTPIWLVEEMLDQLPQHVWTEPNNKWLDPCVGFGSFPVCVYYRLMDEIGRASCRERV